MAQILIMEDDVDLGIHLAGLLQDLGHEVTWTRTRSEALAQCEDSAFDLLVSDIYIYKNGQIINDGGIGLIGSMRIPGRPDHLMWMRNVPVIAMSGVGELVGNKHVLDIAKTVGATMAIAKPFSDADFLELVDLALTEGVARR